MGLAVDVDPEDLSQVTRNFQDAAVAAITGMGGTIATVTPDEILAFFGYPEAHEDDAERAVTAGLDAVAKIGQLVSPKGEPLQARVAVATGLALASQRQAVGEPLVIATEMCDKAAPNSVLVTASTRRFLSRAFVCEDPEQHALAGVSETGQHLARDGEASGREPFQSKALEQDYPAYRPRPGTAAVVGALGSSQAR